MKKNDEFIANITKVSEIMFERGFNMAKAGLSLDKAKTLNKLIIKICLEMIEMEE